TLSWSEPVKELRFGQARRGIPMPLVQVLSILALRPMINWAVEAVERQTGVSLKDKVGPVYRCLTDQFADHSQRLGSALESANERAWRTLEIALVGESWRTWLDRQEDK